MVAIDIIKNPPKRVGGRVMIGLADTWADLFYRIDYQIRP